jgi:hypothetical protein
MNPKILEPIAKFTITPLGLEPNQPFTIDEWEEMGMRIGAAARSMAFVVGDWISYGDSLPFLHGAEKCPQTDILKIASQCTGLDIPTLEAYAFVAAKVPREWRSERLSWEHHRLIAKIPPLEREQWIKDCVAEINSGHPLTLRRLRKSINLGRMATLADLEPEPADKGIDNHIPYVNRLCVWWKHMQNDLFLSRSTPEQREALKNDLEPIVTIYKQL